MNSLDLQIPLRPVKGRRGKILIGKKIPPETTAERNPKMYPKVKFSSEGRTK